MIRYAGDGELSGSVTPFVMTQVWGQATLFEFIDQAPTEEGAQWQYVIKPR